MAVEFHFLAFFLGCSSPVKSGARPVSEALTVWKAEGSHTGLSQDAAWLNIRSPFSKEVPGSVDPLPGWDTTSATDVQMVQLPTFPSWWFRGSSLEATQKN